MDAAAVFKGKKVTLMGLGLLGRGVGDARFLAEAGADLIVTDLKDATALAPSLEMLAGLPITYRLGEHVLEDFQGRDIVLVAPKTPFDSPYVAEAKKSGARVTMSAALAATAAHQVGATVVGVTGTRGKTTTTQMIAHVLRTAGKRVHLGGNIQGVSTLALLPEIQAGDMLVLELDSWQLQGFGSERYSPDVSVFTNFMPDHQDYYASMEAYFADKANIFVYQTPGSMLVVGKDIVSHVTPHEGVECIVADEALVPELIVPGSHNRQNAACALAATRALQIPIETIQEALATFGGVPGRLEFVREVNGIQFYNDTTATTPEATLAALAAFSGKSVVLIMGGSDKGLDMSGLIAATKGLKQVVLLDGSGTKRIANEFPHVFIGQSLSEAFTEAVRSASSGDIVLLSPAFASFGMFTNEYDRGDQFTALVRSL